MSTEGDILAGLRFRRAHGGGAEECGTICGRVARDYYLVELECVPARCELATLATIATWQLERGSAPHASST